MISDSYVMNRRSVLRLFLVSGAGAGAVIGCRNRGNGGPDDRPDPDDWDRRVRFICCNDHDDPSSFSPPVYLREGGGRRAFDTVREAAPYLRPDDPGASAAGLCGFLFKKLGYDGDTGGTMSLDTPPKPGADGKIDWNAFGGDGDIILISVEFEFGKVLLRSRGGPGDSRSESRRAQVREAIAEAHESAPRSASARASSQT